MRDIAIDMSRKPDQLEVGPEGFSATAALGRRARWWLDERAELARSAGDTGGALEHTAAAYERSDEQFRP